MKIAIVGAMGVGKTTLVNSLKERTGMKILPEVAREMINEGYRLDKKITEEIELELIKRQAKLEKQDGEWIVDRCLIDSLAYTMALFPDNTPLINRAKKELNQAKYDIIIYIPPEFSLMGDGVRSTDIKFRDKIDETIKNILKNYKFNIIKGSVKSRTQKVINLIQQKHDKNI